MSGVTLSRVDVGYNSVWREVEEADCFPGFSFSSGNAQNEEGKPAASLSRLAKAEKEETQLPM